MARRARVELNRAALDDVQRGLADGVFGIVSRIADVASERAPDAPPIGEGLVARGAAAVWVNGRKTHETASVDKPPDLRTPSGQIVGAVGFTFPGLFQEVGTVHQPARPFVTPSAADVIGHDAEVILTDRMERRIGRGRGR